MRLEDVTNMSSIQFGSKQSSPILKDGTLRHGSFDGTASAKESIEALSFAADTASTRIHAGLSLHHAARPLGAVNSHYLPASSAGPIVPVQNYTISPPEQSTTPKSSISVRSVSPAFPAIAGAASGEIAQILPERFPWCVETHATPAIRG